MKLSNHFTLEELYKSSTATRYRINNVPSTKVIENLTDLCTKVLEPLRVAWGAPIVVSSGYRCAALNRKVGGAVNSDHVYGNAADIHTLSDTAVDNRSLFDLAVEMMKDGRIKQVKQIIDEYGYDWVHISFQDGRTSKRNQVLHLG